MCIVGKGYETAVLGLGVAKHGLENVFGIEAAVSPVGKELGVDLLKLLLIYDSIVGRR